MPAYDWQVGTWSACSVTCGAGIAVRPCTPLPRLVSLWPHVFPPLPPAPLGAGCMRCSAAERRRTDAVRNRCLCARASTGGQRNGVLQSRATKCETVDGTAAPSTALCARDQPPSQQVHPPQPPLNFAQARGTPVALRCGGRRSSDSSSVCRSHARRARVESSSSGERPSGAHATARAAAA
jgi:hypothetical protein